MESSHLTKSSPNLWGNSPPRVIVHACGFLTATELSKTNAVCVKWRDASESEVLWKTLAVRRFGMSLSEIFCEMQEGDTKRWKRVVRVIYSPFKIVSNIFRKTPHEGSLELLKAAIQGNVRAVQMSLENGARVDHESIKPLSSMIADEQSHAHIMCFLLMVKALIASKGEEFAKHPQAIWALNLAIDDGKLLLAKILVAFGIKTKIDNDSIIRRLVWEGKLETVKFVHENDLFDLVKYRDVDGTTLLDLYSAENLAVMEYLIQIGVPTDVLDKGGLNYKQVFNEKILRAFINEPAEHLKELFEQHVTDVDAPVFENGDTALHNAIRVLIVRRDMGIHIEMLLKKGANPKLPNKKGDTPYSLLKGFLWNNEESLRTEVPEFYKLLKAIYDKLVEPKK